MPVTHGVAGSNPVQTALNQKKGSLGFPFLLKPLNHCIKRLEALAFKETDLSTPLWESYRYPVCRTTYIDYWQQRHKPHHG